MYPSESRGPVFHASHQPQGLLRWTHKARTRPLGIVSKQPKHQGWTLHRQTGDGPESSTEFKSSHKSSSSLGKCPFPDSFPGDQHRTEQRTPSQKQILIPNLPQERNQLLSGGLILFLHTIKGTGLNDHKGALCVGSMAMNPWASGTQRSHCPASEAWSVKQLIPWRDDSDKRINLR